ncbi:hypothetical protein HDF10_003877 [Edaphobacter lichenicola]|uniref:Uncharacterized protein n=1 Tax=Tunturiibacter lichenicola TaxID=2051959 RepID=A0A7W8JD70_9BACT|nr:hypothetical protein [Edaphobacter lichenicola]
MQTNFTGHHATSRDSFMVAGASSRTSLRSQERAYLESEHIFEGTKLRNSKLYHGRSGDNRRNMPLQYGLVLSFLFMSE